MTQPTSPPGGGSESASLHAGSAEGQRSLPLLTAWDVDAGDHATALDLSFEGELAALGTLGGTIATFESATGTPRADWLAHPGGVANLRWSSRAPLLASGGHDGRACICDERGVTLSSIAGHASSVDHLAWSPDGALLALGSGRVASIWTVEGELAWQTDAHDTPITGLAWNSKGTELVTCCSGGAQLFRIGSPPRTRRLPWRGTPITVAWSPTDAIIAFGNHERSVRFWRLSTGQDAEMSGFSATPSALAWNADGSKLATGGDKTIALWSFDGPGPEGTSPVHLIGHEALCTALAFEPKHQRLASGSDDMSVLVWNSHAPNERPRRGLLSDTVVGLAWTADASRLLAIDAAGTLRAWHTPP